MAEVSQAGFFNLNLRFLNDVDNAQISYMKGEQNVELKTAPDCVKPVIRNIEAVLTFVQPLFKRHGLSMMEQVHNEFPDNINTLANLIEMRKEFHMDTKPHEEKLKQMQSEHGSPLEQARCFLEIGYVLLSDLHTEVQKPIEEKLEDILKQLEFQGKSITEHRQMESYQAAVQYLKKGTSQIKHVLPETCIQGTKREQDKAVEYFEDGLDRLEPGNDEASIWKHHLARAHSRIGTGDRNLSTTTEKKRHMLSALQYFMECIVNMSRKEEMSDPLKVYLARSYAYVGHLIATRRKEIKGKNDPIPSFVDRNLWNDPEEAFRRAQKIFDNDRVIHSRYGLTLKDRRFSAEDKEADMLRYINLAIEQFNMALRIENKHNWFAYSQLVQAYMEKYKAERRLFLDESKGSSHQEPNKNDLKEAIKNGECSLQQRVTSKTLLDISEAYYLKSMRPEKGRDGLDIVEDRSCLRAAQEYIQKAFDHHDCKEHEKVKILFGKCLFHDGDRKEGIEQILHVLTKKRNTITEPHYFRELMIMMLNYFREWKDDKRNEVKKRQRRQKLRKIWCVLDSGKKTYKKRFKHPLIGMVNLYPHEFIYMLMEVYQFDTRSKGEQELIKECLQALRHHHARDVKRRLEELEKAQPCQPDDGIYRREAPASPNDFCLCFHKEDSMWIQTFIDERDTLQKMNRKHCWKAEDLEFSEKMKFVFVLSESFNKDPDCLSMVSTVKGNYKTSNRLIPVLRDNSNVDVPLLADVTPLDFTGLRNSYDVFMSALLQKVDDDNVPKAASISVPNVEGVASTNQESMDVDMVATASERKTWAEQTEASDMSASDDDTGQTLSEDDTQMCHTGQTLSDDAGMDSGFISQNASVENI